MKIPFLAWLFQGLPEAIGIAAVMYAVAGRSLRWRSIVTMGFIFGVAFYLIRLLPIAFGINTVFNFLFTVAVFKQLTYCNLAIAIRSGLVALITVVLAETIFIPLFVLILDMSIEEIYSNLLLRILSGWPSVVMLFVVAVLASKFIKKDLHRGWAR